MHVVKEGQVGETTWKVVYDQDPMNPREEYDNLATLVCWHRRYDLGDRTVRPDDYDSLSDMILTIAGENAVVVGLWLYDHGSLTISAGDANPFSCRWDSGMVGFAYVTAERIVQEYGADTEENRALARQCILGEVETYDRYLRGEVYGYVVENDYSDDSCWGIDDDDYARQEAVSTAEAMEAERLQVLAKRHEREVAYLAAL